MSAAASAKLSWLVEACRWNLTNALHASAAGEGNALPVGQRQHQQAGQAVLTSQARSTPVVEPTQQTPWTLSPPRSSQRSEAPLWRG